MKQTLLIRRSSQFALKLGVIVVFTIMMWALSTHWFDAFAAYLNPLFVLSLFGVIAFICAITFGVGYSRYILNRRCR